MCSACNRETPARRSHRLYHRHGRSGPCPPYVVRGEASQVVKQARAIPCLSVRAYDWWSEALHGVAVNGTTELPEPIGLAATFDELRIHEMGMLITLLGEEPIFCFSRRYASQNDHPLFPNPSNHGRNLVVCDAASPSRKNA